jgi:hypothetical protein
MSWTGIVGQGIGMLGGAKMTSKGYHRQKKLMGFQKGHQMDLNRHGQELAMDMWNQTNYGAQVDHMKKAGLNPALMYGSAGQGGSTNAGSGGSAQGGQAPQEKVMDMSNMLVGAEIALKEAQKRNIDRDTDLKGKDVDKTVQETANLVAGKLKIEQEISESKQRELNLKTENEIKEHDKDWLKRNNLSTYDVGIIRALKSGGMSIADALNYFKENGPQLKLDINQIKTGVDEGGRSYMINKRGEKVYY